MKNISFILIFGLIVSTSIFGQKTKIETINSKVLGQERNILIYTPWQYDKYPDKKFEIIYVFDAQAREYFDLVHSMIQFLGGEEFAFIVVGIESPSIEDKNQSRDMDFLPVAVDKDMIKKYAGYTGGTDKFLSFLKTEVLPFIDKNYRTLPERVAVGHSNGGTSISYSLLIEPELFDSYIAISPNYAFDKGQFVKRFQELNPEIIKKEKFLFISNSNENAKTSNSWVGWSESNKEIVKTLKNKKFKSKIYLKSKDFSKS